MTLKVLEKTDIPSIVDGFQKSRWQIKPASLFQGYFEEQNQGLRLCFVTYKGTDFAGYATLKWRSNYKHFSKRGIPEISDLNVLPDFRNEGIG